MLEEKELIKFCIQGNPLAQKELYDRFSKKLYGLCLRYAASEEEAEDILQDGFVKIFTKLTTFKHEGSFEGWMKRIVIHTAIEEYRKRHLLEKIEENTNDPVLSIQEDQSLEVEELLKLIQNLPPGYRLVFNLYAIEGYSHAEVAEKLNISEGTSKSQLARARAYLQKKIITSDKLKISHIQPFLLLFRLICNAI